MSKEDNYKRTREYIRSLKMVPSIPYLGRNLNRIIVFLRNLLSARWDVFTVSSWESSTKQHGSWIKRLEQAVGTPWEWGLPDEGPRTRDILLLIQMPSESQASPACSSEGSRDSYWSIRILLNWGSMSVAQSCPTLPSHGQGPARLSIHGIFQARIVEWVAISFCRGSSWPRDWTWVFHIVSRLFTVLCL